MLQFHLFLACLLKSLTYKVCTLSEFILLIVLLEMVESVQEIIGIWKNSEERLILIIASVGWMAGSTSAAE
jgi:hypothetical protein